MAYQACCLLLITLPDVGLDRGDLQHGDGAARSITGAVQCGLRRLLFRRGQFTQVSNVSDGAVERFLGGGDPAPRSADAAACTCSV